MGNQSKLYLIRKNIMYKISALLPLLFLGALAFPNNRYNEDEAKAMVHIIMCACDDDFSGGIGHDELNSDVCLAITQYEVSQEDFGHCDTNDDGEIDLDEALAAIEKYQNESAGRALTAFNRDNFFSNDAHVEAVVRVMGCVCDQDGSWTLDMDEISSPDCQDLQNFIFGDTCDEECFHSIDGDGHIDGHELAYALEKYWGIENEYNDDHHDDEAEAMVHIVMCACDDDFSGAISHDELNSDVCLAITQYEVPQEDFAQCDTNGDGEIDLAEAFAALEKYQNASMRRALTAFNRDNFFSNDAHVEAVVRVVGCVCDHDGSWTLDFDEVSGNDCQDLQYFIFGGTCDQDCFDATDANGDGFVDGHELAASLEGMDTAAGR